MFQFLLRNFLSQSLCLPLSRFPNKKTRLLTVIIVTRLFKVDKLTCKVWCRTKYYFSKKRLIKRLSVSLGLLAFHYFWKTLHLRCLADFSIRLWLITISAQKIKYMSIDRRYFYCIFKRHVTSICEKKSSADVRLKFMQSKCLPIEFCHSLKKE